MNDKQKVTALFAALAIVAVFLFLRFRPASARQVVQAEAASGNLGFYEPYYWPTAGIAPQPNLMFGGKDPYGAPINVYVSNPVYGGLTNQYMPVFGFVGVTAVGA